TTELWAAAWRSSRASPKHPTDHSPSPRAPEAGSTSQCNYRPHQRPLAALNRTGSRPARQQAAARSPRVWGHGRQEMTDLAEPVRGTVLVLDAEVGAANGSGQLRPLLADLNREATSAGAAR